MEGVQGKDFQAEMHEQLSSFAVVITGVQGLMMEVCANLGAPWRKLTKVKVSYVPGVYGSPQVAGRCCPISPEMVDGACFNMSLKILLADLRWVVCVYIVLGE